jgi:6-phosphogluconolactonase
MKSFNTPVGRLQVGSEEAIFRSAIGLIEGAASQENTRLLRLGLSGGSTPKALYKWAAEEKALSEQALRSVLWMTSDERMVPVESDESNFGNLQRLLLTQLKVPATHQLPWPVNLSPESAAKDFQSTWDHKWGPHAGFDICFLGLGEDGHTASLFPHCPLIGQKHLPAFSATEWPGKGWRLTITETGLERAGLIVVLASGANKAAVLKEIFHGPVKPHQYPAQILQAFASKVVWLVDEAAAVHLISLQA